MATKELESITLAESKELLACEKTIDGAKETFHEVARALATIRDKKLYRAEYPSFAAYCKERHGWSKTYGYDMAAAGKVIKELPESFSAIAENESQVRELAKVPQGKRSAVIKAALEAGPVTAKAIREAAAEVSEPERPAVVAHTEVMPNTEADEWVDAFGGKVPPIPNDPHQYPRRCGLHCLEQLKSASGCLAGADLAELESLKAYWHTECMEFLNERIKELKAEAKREAKSQKKGKA